MGDAIMAETISITTGRTQTLYLDEKDKALIDGREVIIVDDVISTGSTLSGMKKIVGEANGKISAIATIFTEGDSDWSDIIALGNLPVFAD
jgi:adenine phosphoribosyltransferase